jgi:hypothetical protein
MNLGTDSIFRLEKWLSVPEFSTSEKWLSVPEFSTSEKWLSVP